MTNSSVIPLRRPLSIAQIDRPSVIALVQDDVAYFNRAVAAGHDAQQVGIQRREQIDKFVQTLAPNEALAFLNLYHEEAAAARRSAARSSRARKFLSARDWATSSLGAGFAILSIVLTIILVLISEFLFK